MLVALLFATAHAASPNSITMSGGGAVPSCDAYTVGTYSGKDCTTRFGLQVEGEQAIGDRLMVSWESDVARWGQSDIAFAHQLAQPDLGSPPASVAGLDASLTVRLGARLPVGPGDVVVRGGLLFYGDKPLKNRDLIEYYQVAGDVRRTASAGAAVDVGYFARPSELVELGFEAELRARSPIAVSLDPYVVAGDAAIERARLYRGRTYQQLLPTLQANLGGESALHLELGVPELSRMTSSRALMDAYTAAGWNTSAAVTAAWIPTVKVGYRLGW